LTHHRTRVAYARIARFVSAIRQRGLIPCGGALFVRPTDVGANSSNARQRSHVIKIVQQFVERWTMKMPRFIVVILTMAAIGGSQTLSAQTSPEQAAMEARLMAKLERRIAEEGTETKGQIDALRISFKQTIESLSKSSNDLDRKILVAVDTGATKD